MSLPKLVKTRCLLFKGIPEIREFFIEPNGTFHFFEFIKHKKLKTKINKEEEDKPI